MSGSREVVMMPNGLVHSWMARGPDEGQLLTGCDEATTERIAKKWAALTGCSFRKMSARAAYRAVGKADA